MTVIRLDDDKDLAAELRRSAELLQHAARLEISCLPFTEDEWEAEQQAVREFAASIRSSGTRVR